MLFAYISVSEDAATIKTGGDVSLNMLLLNVNFMKNSIQFLYETNTFNSDVAWNVLSKCFKDFPFLYCVICHLFDP